MPGNSLALQMPPAHQPENFDPSIPIPNYYIYSRLSGSGSHLWEFPLCKPNGPHLALWLPEGSRGTHVRCSLRAHRRGAGTRTQRAPSRGQSCRLESTPTFGGGSPFRGQLYPIFGFLTSRLDPFIFRQITRYPIFTTTQPFLLSCAPALQCSPVRAR